MNLIVVGTNHKYSPIEIRERLVFSKTGLKEALSVLLGYSGIKGAVILSTCNRLELYAGVLNIEEAVKSLKGFLIDYHHQNFDELAPYLYTYIGKEAALHLFNVACGIDSQIIGETQILEQIRFAHDEAKIIEATDRLLSTVFNQAIKLGERVREETQIAKGDVSLGALSIGLIKERLGSIKDKKVLIIGVGKISEAVIKSLKEEEVRAIFIANRNIQRADELAKLINAEVVRFDSLKEKLTEAEVIISATSSPHLLLRKEDILETKPLLIIDLGVPRNVDPAIKYLKQVSLFCLDDLDFKRNDILNRRKQEIPRIQMIIGEEIEKLCREPLKSEAAGAHLL